MDHGHRQRQALTHTQRQATGQAVGLAAEVEAREHLLHARATPFGRQVEQPCVQVEVLPHGQLAVQRKRLGHVADPLAGLHVMRVHRLAEQQRLALAGWQQTGEHFHGGGLAAAVRAEKAEDFTAGNAEIDLIHRDEIAEAHGQPMGLDGNAFAVRLRRDDQFTMLTALGFRQQADKGLFQRVAASARQQLGRCAGGQYAAGIHRYQLIEALRLVHVGSGHQHAHLRALVTDAFDQFPELRA